MNASPYALATFFLEDEHDAVVPRLHYCLEQSYLGQQPITYDILLDSDSTLFTTPGNFVADSILVFHYDDPMTPRPFATNAFLRVTRLCPLLQRYSLCEASPTSTCLWLSVRPEVQEIAATVTKVPLLRVTWGL